MDRPIGRVGVLEDGGSYTVWGVFLYIVEIHEVCRLIVLSIGAARMIAARGWMGIHKEGLGGRSEGRERDYALR